VYNTGTVKDEDQKMAEKQKKKKQNEKQKLEEKKQQADPSNRVFKSEHREIPDTLGK
jgi:hypothetical protein